MALLEHRSYLALQKHRMQEIHMDMGNIFMALLKRRMYAWHCWSTEYIHIYTHGTAGASKLPGTAKTIKGMVE